MSLHLREYDPRDSDAVWRLHEWAMREAGTDPTDIPGTEDLQNIESAYLDTGGAFLTGVVSEDSTEDCPSTFDGAVVAIGGFLPSGEGHEDERTVPGAAELHRMRVAPPLQGAGYGRQLLSALESRAADAGFDCVIATTASRQQRAIQLYSAAGYREVDRSTLGEYELHHFEKPL